MKLEPDYKSDNSILDEDSDDDSVDSNTNDKRKSEKGASQEKSQDEIEKEKPKSKKEKHVEFESQLEFSPDMCFESDSVVSPDLKVEESEVAVSTDNMSTDNHSHPSLEESSGKVIPEDISLPSQFLLPNLDDYSSEEETEITELKTEAENPSIVEVTLQMPYPHSSKMHLLHACRVDRCM